METRSVKTFIVITSIYPPSKAVHAYARMNDYSVIVVADKKTPVDWQQSGVIYLSIADQMTFSEKFSNTIPFNHYGRKMIGYAYAIQRGAEVIIDADDDIMPYENWRFPNFNDQYKTTQPELGWVNIYQEYSDENIWPRGLPLRNIKDNRDKIIWETNRINSSVGIWQGLTDGDPDVDAIFRLTYGKQSFFKKSDPVVLSKGTVCPINSQNTAIRKELFPLLFLPSFVTFRFTDILRGIIAQPICWHQGFHIGFTEATTIQERNLHDYLKDFESEIPMYLHGERAFDTVREAMRAGSVKDNLINAYEALLSTGIVEKNEMKLLQEWLKLC